MSLSLAALNLEDAVSTVTAAHTIDELTTKSLTGTGVFDVLMQAVKLHMKEEFDSRRITGKEYAQVYLGALTGVMQSAVTYLLQDQQIEKTRSEISLLRQKTVTELAQTSNTIPTGLGFNDTEDVNGALGKQKELYAAQIAGFARDAEQKLAKDLMDTWSVRRTTDEGTTVGLNGLHDAAIKEVIDKARQGIGLNASTIISGS